MSDSTENTSKPSREQLEARVVAMQLGEASPFEDEQLREQLKGDAALARFCAEIGQTLPLLNEALDVGQALKAKSPKPRLARKRRGKLKLLFRSDTGLAKRRILWLDFRKTLAVAAAVCVVLFIAAGLLLPNLSKAGSNAGRTSANQTKGIAASEATQVAESKLTATAGYSMVEAGKNRPDSTLLAESFANSIQVGGEADLLVDADGVVSTRGIVVTTATGLGADPLAILAYPSSNIGTGSSAGGVDCAIANDSLTPKPSISLDSPKFRAWPCWFSTKPAAIS